MIQLSCGVGQTRLDIIRHKVRIIREDFRLRHPSRDEIEHIFHADTHPPNARATAALLRIKRDALPVIHKKRLLTDYALRKACLDGVETAPQVAPALALYSISTSMPPIHLAKRL